MITTSCSDLIGLAECSHEKIRRAETVAQWVRCSMCKPEHPSSVPSTHIRNWVQWAAPVIPGLEGGDRKIVRAYLLNSLADQ